MDCCRDQWTVNPAEKHLLASQAKTLYAAYWDEYFKFAFVRDPLARTLSCLASYPEHFGLCLSANGDVDFSGYHARFGEEVVLEHDYRFHQRAALITNRHKPGRVYSNMLDEELDFIGRLETLGTDTAFVRDRLALPHAFTAHVEQSRRAKTAISAGTREKVERLYRQDYVQFGLSRD